MKHRIMRAVHHALAIIPFMLAAVSGCSSGPGPGDTAWNGRVREFRRAMAMNGYSLHYIDTGKGTPLLLVHGFADSSYSWHKNLDALAAAGFRCILVDQPGMGRSEVPPGNYRFTVENQTREVLALMDRLGVRRFYLAGHSMGGGIALHILTHRPERVIRAAVVDPLCYKVSGLRATGLPGARTVVGIFAGRFTTRLALRDVYYDDELVTDAMVDEYSRFYSRPGYFDAVIGIGRDFVSEEFAAMAGTYGGIRTPLLIIWGGKDTWIRPEFGTRLHRAIPGSRLEIIARAGHSPHQERPGETNRALIGFLTR